MDKFEIIVLGGGHAGVEAAAAHAVGMPVGCGLSTAIENVVKFAKRGVQWFQVGGDCPYMVEFHDKLFAEAKSQLDRI